MPRTTAIGNGRLFIAHDDHWTVRELCWPTTGTPNHLLGHKIRLGIWCGGAFSWTESEACHLVRASMDSQHVARAGFSCARLGLDFEVVDCVHEDQDEWVRHVTLTDTLGESRPVWVFQSHDLRLRESDVSDTAFFHPGLNGTVHYKEDVACSFAAVSPVSGYACGMKGHGGMEGTWRDAEDGELSGKPIEQGTVDSTFSVEVLVPAGGSATVRLVARFATSIRGLEQMGKAEVCEPPHRPKARTLRDVSLDVVKAHFARSAEGAGLVAGCDSDIMVTNRANYASVWLRDHALGCLTLLEHEETDLVAEGIAFGLNALNPENLPLGHPPVFMQKYTPSGRIGPGWHPWNLGDERVLPWQEDETALFVTLFAEAMARGVPGEWRSENETVLRSADYLAAAVGDDGLPNPGWDLWEERRGVHCWTTATVVEALTHAIDLAEGDPTRQRRYSEVAERMRRAFMGAFFGLGDPVRTLTPHGPDATPDMSVLAAVLRSPFRRDKDLVDRAMRHCGRHLWCDTATGGFARYAGDYYFRVREGYPGNPWVISTLWVAQAWSLTEHDDPSRWTGWVEARATPTKMLAEQFHPDTGTPLGVQPLAWSHAEYLETLVRR